MGVIEAAQSALSSFSTAQAVTANNIANVNTAGFSPSRTVFEERPDYAGVAVQDITTAGGGGLAVGEAAAPNVYSETDLATEITTLMTNQRAFEASAAVIRSQDDMLGTLLDSQV